MQRLGHHPTSLSRWLFWSVQTPSKDSRSTVLKHLQASISATVQEVDAASLAHLPIGLDGASYQGVDLDGEGLSGILTEQAGTLYYKRNLSPAPVPNGPEAAPPAAAFGPAELVVQQPSLLATSGGRQQWLDLAGDGQLDLVVFDGPAPGFYERTSDNGWEPFQLFTSLPRLDWSNPNLRFVDLTGDVRRPQPRSPGRWRPRPPR